MPVWVAITCARLASSTFPTGPSAPTQCLLPPALLCGCSCSPVNGAHVVVVGVQHLLQVQAHVLLGDV